MSGRFFRTQDKRPAHAFRIAVHVGIERVDAPAPQNRAVGPHIDRIEGGLVVADADNLEAPLAGGHKGRDRPASGDFPLIVALAGNDLFAGAKTQHAQIDACLPVPSLFLGVPDKERLMLADPGRLHGFGGLRGSGRDNQGQQQQACQ